MAVDDAMRTPALTCSTISSKSIGRHLKFERWKEFFEAIGFIAIVASLVFVGMELRQSRAIAISEGNLANAQIQIERNNAISEYSIVWTKGNSGEPLAEHEAAIFENLVRNQAIHSFMEYARLGQVEFDDAAETVTAQFAIFLFQNPGARNVWQQSEEFYALNFEVPPSQAAWRDEVRAKLTRLQRQSSQ